MTTDATLYQEGDRRMVD